MSTNMKQFEQIIFEQQIMNKCSSYIDSNNQYKLAAELFMEESVKRQSSKTNIKKIRSIISNKLRKLISIHSSPDQFLPKQSKKSKKSSKHADSSIKLVNFNYKSNFVTLNASQEIVRHRDEHVSSRRIQMTPIQNKHRFESFEKSNVLKSTRRYSNGMSSGSSSSSSRSSLASCVTNSDDLFLVQTGCNDLFESELFKSSQISHLFPQEKSSCLNLTENLIETSTPVLNNRRVSRTSLEQESKEISMYLFNDETEEQYSQNETEENNVACYLDQSTQCQVDSPVLLESTFDSSSLSNLSDDLIILQTASAPIQPAKNSSSKKQQKQQSSISKNDWNLQVIDKYANNTNATFNNMPNWAVGNNLNLALVNQLYYNPTANGVFNPSAFFENTFSN